MHIALRRTHIVPFPLSLRGTPYSLHRRLHGSVPVHNHGNVRIKLCVYVSEAWQG